VALGRKNYLFAGSDAGGERAAAIYSPLIPIKTFPILRTWPTPTAFREFINATDQNVRS